MGGAEVIDGRAVAAAVKRSLEADVRSFVSEYGRAPGLATILVGDDPASAVYVGAKRQACDEVGIHSSHHHLPATASEGELLKLIDQLNEAEGVDAILCQLPLPPGLAERTVINRIDPGKDVDGLTTVSSGRLASGLDGLRPCTPSGVMTLLAHAGVELEGTTAVVIGRSNLFGKPMAHLLLEANATVTVCHSRTKDLPAICRSADLLIAAVGRPKLVEKSWVQPGAVVIDVGITRTDAGLVGDVDFDAVRHVASTVTPVPGGVGPMTIACLLQNTLLAARLRAAPTNGLGLA